MTTSSLLPPGVPVGGCSESDSSSDSSASDNDGHRLNQSQGALSQTEDLVTVTVKKISPTQKSGLALVERKKYVYVTNVVEQGLFHGTEISVGDKILSINGKRIKQGEGAKSILKQIAKAKSTVTMVVKKNKNNRKLRRGVLSLSPLTQRKTRHHATMRKSVVERNMNPSVPPMTRPLESNDDRPPILISIPKVSPNQDIGIQLQDVENKVIVTSITASSIVKTTKLPLEVGDRIVDLVGTNFSSRGDSKCAMQLLVTLLPLQELMILIDKRRTSMSNTNDGESIPDKTMMSQHSERKSSSSRKPTSETSSSDDENPTTTPLGTPSQTTTRKKRITNPERKLRKSKGDTTSKTSSGKSKAISKGSTHSGSSHVRKPTSRGDNDSEESSMGDFASEEQRARFPEKNSPSPKSPRARSISKLNPYANLGKSITFDYDAFHGDFIKITVQKESETRSGLSLERMEGKFVLTAVPDHEKRIYPGMQVLAINGNATFHSIMKAEELINRTKDEIRLVLDFSSPFKPQIKCPCCSRPLTADGKHTNGILSRRVVRRQKEPPTDSSDGAELMSVAASEITTRVTNKAPPGKRTQRRPERPPKYQFEEFDSDSDEDGANKSPKSSSQPKR